MFPFKKKEGGKIRIATLNVGTAKNQWGIILEKVREHEIDVLCIQETRLNYDNSANIRGQLAMEGWRTFVGEARQDGNGCPNCVHFGTIRIVGSKGGELNEEMMMGKG